MTVKPAEGKGFYHVDLNITDVTTQDGGNYKVVAKNEHGEAKSTIELNFEGKWIMCPWSLINNRQCN